MNTTQKFESTGHRWWQALIVGLALTMVAGCIENGDDRKPGSSTAEHTLTPVTSCDEVRDHFTEALTEDALEYLYGRYSWGMDDNGVAEDSDAAPDSGGSNGDNSESPSEFTDTNVQEEGVDEPDIVKTDGTHIYTITDGALQILKSWPADETELLGRHDFESGANPMSLFLHGDKAVVFSRQYGSSYYAPSSSGGEPRGETSEGSDSTDEGDSISFRGTRITIFDVSDKSEPQELRSIEIEGDFVDGRMIDGRIFTVTNSRMRNLSVWNLLQDADYLQDDLPERTYDESEEELEQMREDARPILASHISQKLADIDADEWLPRQKIVDSEDGVVSSGQVYECTDLYLPGVAADLGVLNISSFYADGDTDFDSTGLVARGWEVYASKSNLYVAMSSRTWWWGWNWGDRTNESHIHKFSLTGNAKPKYMASGRVDGWILNQFSFSEHKNHLRVATTDNQWEWNPDIQEAEDSGGNHMIVLKRQGDELVETGSVRDLAPTERIYSARFAGDRGYIVTFREVDPLYTFDLSDPNNPQMLGELKITGFSSYMHPLDEDHLLAIGLDGDENGIMSGVHLQVFDVSDMTDPQLAHHHVISTGSWSSFSEAMYNHHAFTYQDRLGVLGVPMTIREDGERFSGLMLFDATVDGITEIGRIDHGDLVAQAWCERNGYDSMEDCDFNPDNYPWWSRMRRSIMMSGDDGEEFVYSLSDVGLKVTETFDDTQELSSVLLQQ